MSEVRSALVGLIVFVVLYWGFTNRRLLIAMSALVGLIAVATLPYWAPALLPDVVTLERAHGDASDLGSGRPKYWAHNLQLFADLPIDQKIAGIGIGNIAGH